MFLQFKKKKKCFRSKAEKYQYKSETELKQGERAESK